MKKTILLILLVASSCAHAAATNDANSAVMENITRFEQYEQTAQQMSQGESQMISPDYQSNQMSQASQPIMSKQSKTMDSTPTPTQADSSVYQSIKILIESGNLTDKQKIKLISQLSS
ncbi:hypothetical protein VIN01S_30590 [Vibrio inusitatus NBRC 102082]|uniref:Lipoprotein n=1 Tax=Vibrio inusitatus NBRC 102082 TaxID=1219070 RepID=A0A4Y3HYZ3_9VIBR|nr:hypothetical protein [Vibrio inusitatus]GEA52255.1 hypothetical protein VIN01S_30590 [Vibrio inusitatus NBRC 102082]